MPTPLVTRRHLEQAWLEATGAATTTVPVRWNTDLVRSFVREVPTVASVILAAGQKNFRHPERAAVAQWIAAWLHRAYKLAGVVRFAPLSKDDLVGLLGAEHAHLVLISKMTATQLAAAELAWMEKIPNGDLLTMLMQLWGRAITQIPQQGEAPEAAVQDTYFARFHLAVTLAALNLSAKRAG